MLDIVYYKNAYSIEKKFKYIYLHLYLFTSISIYIYIHIDIVMNPIFLSFIITALIGDADNSSVYLLLYSCNFHFFFSSIISLSPMRLFFQMIFLSSSVVKIAPHTKHWKIISYFWHIIISDTG